MPHFGRFQALDTDSVAETATASPALLLIEEVTSSAQLHYLNATILQRLSGECRTNRRGIPRDGTVTCGRGPAVPIERTVDIPATCCVRRTLDGLRASTLLKTYASAQMQQHCRTVSVAQVAGRMLQQLAQQHLPTSCKFGNLAWPRLYHNQGDGCQVQQDRLVQKQQTEEQEVLQEVIRRTHAAEVEFDVYS